MRIPRAENNVSREIIAQRVAAVGRMGKECLQMLGCAGTGNARKFAEIAAAVVLAGELSVVAAFAAREFVQAHQKLSRNGLTGDPPDRAS